MANVLNYVRSYGFLPFTQKPFTPEDNVALCAVFYMPFENVVPSEIISEPISFAAAAKMLYEKNGLQHKGAGLFLPKTLSILMMQMSEKKRYAEMQMIACRNIIAKKPATQFAATTFLLPNDTAVVVFRGTDDTLTGWKEDIDLLQTTDGAPSAKLAVAYLQEIAESHKGDIIICGHSKGGYLALYAALHTKPEIRNRIIAIYNNDGLGLSESDYLDSDNYTALQKIYHHYIPRSSFFGMMLHHDNDYQTVKSNRHLGIAQHDLLTWQFDGDRLMVGAAVSKESRFNDSFFAELVDALNDEERSEIDRAVTDFVKNAGGESLTDVKARTGITIMNAVKAVHSQSKDTKRTFFSIGKKISRAAKASAKK